MKKAVVLVGLLVLVCGVLFAQVRENVWTDDGFYTATIVYSGNKPGNGVNAFSFLVESMQKGGSRITTNVKLTNGQWQCVNHMLNKYTHSSGDIFFIVLYHTNLGRNSPTYGIFVEYTSTTQYTYWTYSAW